MESELILKVAGIGMIVAVVCQLLSKSGRDEQSTMVSLAGIIVVMLVLASKLGEIITTIKEVFGL